MGGRRYGRRSIRLPAWDYRWTAAYFVTICTHERQLLFDDPRLLGVVETIWRAIPTHPGYCHVHLDAWVVMPNHVHGIIVFQHVGDQDHPAPVGARPPGISPPSPPVSPLPVASPSTTQSTMALAYPCPPRRAAPGTLGAVVGAFKSQTTRRINHMRRTPGAPVWQRGYYERILRGDHELDRTRDYIRDNPARWAADRDAVDTLVARMDRRD